MKKNGDITIRELYDKCVKDSHIECDESKCDMGGMAGFICRFLIYGFDGFNLDKIDGLLNKGVDE